MTRYDFLETRWLILSNIRSDHNLTNLNFGIFCVARKLIINGGAISLRGFLFFIEIPISYGINPWVYHLLNVFADACWKFEII